MVVKIHWLYGKVTFNIDVEKDDNCAECIHCRVCKKNMQDFCENFDFSTSEGEPKTCDQCIHRFTRFFTEEEHKIPCFKCRHFKAEVGET